MAQNVIRYDILTQDAFRGLVRKVLSDVARSGLPGEHHFYVSFDTRARGVRLSPRLREKYPEEMTIVLQHQFWDLSVTEYAFEVGLSFGNVPERLIVPFTAVKMFSDPSAPFRLEFDMSLDEPAEAAAADESEPAGAPPALPPADRQPRGARSEPVETPPAKSRRPDVKEADKAGAEVLSLDSFRKK